MSGETSLLSPEKAVFGYAIAFIIGGLVGAMIAGEIRKQVEAPLLEAETRRQVDRLEHDLSVARSIKQSLLPSVTPEIEDFEIAGMEPARGSDRWRLLRLAGSSEWDTKVVYAPLLIQVTSSRSVTLRLRYCLPTRTDSRLGNSSVEASSL